MVDITTNHLITRSRRLPKLGFSRAVFAMIKVLSQAFEMAYVAPYGTMARRPPFADLPDLQGRDPHW